MKRPAKRESAPLPVTREEIIADSIAKLRRDHAMMARREIAMPSRHFEIGQKVELGGLTDAFVVEIHDNDRIIVLEYTRLTQREKTPIGPAWAAFWWYKVFPLPIYEGQSYARRNAWNHYLQSTLDSFIWHVCEERYRDNPDYQRSYVWTHDDRVAFIDSIFQGRELGRFVFVQYPYPDVEYEILDGKQRLQALKEFMLSHFKYRGNYWHEFSPTDRAIVSTAMVQYVELDASRFKRSELLQIFLEINAAGVPQTEEHLTRVRLLYQKALAAGE